MEKTILDCHVIYDLLPFYIEHTTSDDSNTLIQEHLHCCKNCQLIIKQMTADFDWNTELKQHAAHNTTKTKTTYSRLSKFVIIYSIILAIITFLVVLILAYHVI